MYFKWVKSPWRPCCWRRGAGQTSVLPERRKHQAQLVSQHRRHWWSRRRVLPRCPQPCRYWRMYTGTLPRAPSAVGRGRSRCRARASPRSGFPATLLLPFFIRAAWLLLACCLLFFTAEQISFKSNSCCWSAGTRCLKQPLPRAVSVTPSRSRARSLQRARASWQHRNGSRSGHSACPSQPSCVCSIILRAGWFFGGVRGQQPKKLEYERQPGSSSCDPTEQSRQTSSVALGSGRRAAKRREISVISEETQQEDSGQLGSELLALRFGAGSRAPSNPSARRTLYTCLQIKAAPTPRKKKLSPAKHPRFPWNKELRQYEVFL